MGLPSPSSNQIIIAIPTCDRHDLLVRTLESLAECSLPENLRSIIIAENGRRCGAEKIVEEFQGRLPIEYHFTEQANKSRTLNELLDSCTDEFLLFFDDDVRFHPETIKAYADAAAATGRGRFYGGRCYGDYEEKPEEWMLPYLPRSVKGWDLGDETRELVRPSALGFNWGAFAQDLKSLDGFDEKRGPGSLSRGQETEMQERLLEADILGQYVPEAIVWHYVPKERCSIAWALERAQQNGVAWGINLRKRPLNRQVYHWLRCHLQCWMTKAMLRLRKHSFSSEERFQHQYKEKGNRGALIGMKLHETE